ISTVLTRRCGSERTAPGSLPRDRGSRLNWFNRYRVAAQTQSLFGCEHNSFAFCVGRKIPLLPHRICDGEGQGGGLEKFRSCPFYFPGKRSALMVVFDLVVAAATASSQPPGGALMAVASSGCGMATKASALSLALSSCFGSSHVATSSRLRAASLSPPFAAKPNHL